MKEVEKTTKGKGETAKKACLNSFHDTGFKYKGAFTVNTGQVQ